MVGTAFVAKGFMHPERTRAASERVPGAGTLTFVRDEIIEEARSGRKRTAHRNGRCQAAVSAILAQLNRMHQTIRPLFQHYQDTINSFIKQKTHHQLSKAFWNSWWHIGVVRSFVTFFSFHRRPTLLVPPCRCTTYRAIVICLIQYDRRHSTATILL